MASSSSSPRLWKYDVFLSFRGEDTRRTIVSHLHSELQRKGIVTFKDNHKLRTGDSISDELPKAIKESRFAVVVISKNYASSRWCLDEIEMIMECAKKEMLTVIPIFYEVYPSDVRKQRGTFAEAFEKYDVSEMAEKVQRWRNALTEVASLTGVDSRTCLDEAAMVREIVGDISKRLFSLSPGDSGDIIGMDAHLEALDPLLRMRSNDEVRMVGIWGMGGIGKTTIAVCLYNKISCQFPFHCFIGNIKKISSDHGLGYLQGQFLSEILHEENLKFHSLEDGSKAIKARLSNHKVLAILDDVDQLNQLHALAKETSWFGPGSVIVITTRDKGLLISTDALVYEVKCLGDDAALSLFSQFAFRERPISNDFIELSVRATKLVQGLPLALKVFGSFLCGRTIEEWEMVILKLRGDTRKIIMESLKVSYDGLDVQDKIIFLSVACLFNEERLSHVVQLLDGEELELSCSLKILAEKSLIDISNDGQMRVHDLIQEMAGEIVCQQSADEPCRRRFLFSAEDIYDGLAYGTGTFAVEGISLAFQLPKFPAGSRALGNMQNLKFLKISTPFLYGKDLWQIEDLRQMREALNHLPHRLRLLEWSCCPLTTLPPTFHAENLVELHLHDSNLERLWEGTPVKCLLANLSLVYSLSACLSSNSDPSSFNLIILTLCVCYILAFSSLQSLGNLRRMNLRSSYYLKEIPNLSGATKLEELDLSSCYNLVEVPSSFPSLKKLTWLSTRNCPKLEFLPSATGLLSLKVLDSGACSSLKSFPELPESLVELYLGETAIEEVPESIQNLTDLEILDLSNCKMLLEISGMIGNVTALKKLNLRNCEKLRSIPDAIQNLTALRELDLAFCKVLEHIPRTIHNLSSLKILNLSYCEMLLEIPSTKDDLSCLRKQNLRSYRKLRNIPHRLGNSAALQKLKLEFCNMLEDIPSKNGNLTALKCLDLSGCKMLSMIPKTIGNCSALEVLNLFGCEMLLEIPSTIGNLTALEKLNIRSCEKIQSIPNTIGNLTAFRELDLTLCKTLTCIPSTIGSLTALQTLNLFGCEMVLEIPSTIGNLTALEELNLSWCEKLENIPHTIGNLVSLRELDLTCCMRLTRVPSTIGNLKALRKLYLMFCKLLMDIPSTIGNSTSLEILDLLGCEMLSEIPSTIGNLTALKKLNLRSCERLRNVPSTIGNLSALQELDLRSCKMLTGIPSTVGNLSALEILDLLGCETLVELPSTIGNLTALKKLNLKGCKKLRNIPNTAENLAALQ